MNRPYDWKRVERQDLILDALLVTFIVLMFLAAGVITNLLTGGKVL